MPPTLPAPSRRDALLLAAALAFALLLRAPLAAIPLERDEGEYGYIAQRWLLGDLPYRDAFDQKPPGAFGLYAGILRVFGSSPEAIHWGTQVYALGTLALVFVLARRLFDVRAAFAATLLTAFLCAGRGVLGNAANTETFMLLPLVGALLATLVAAERDSLAAATVAGVASGAALLCKQVALPNLAVALLFVAWRSRRHGAATLAFLVGVAASLAPTLAYFASAGAWREFYDSVVGHNLTYASRLPLAQYATTFTQAFRALAPTWWPTLVFAAIGAGVGLRARLSGRDPEARWLLLAAWSLASCAGVAAGGYFRAHYFLQLVPAVALFAAVGIVAIADHGSRMRGVPARGRRAAPALAATAVLTAAAIANGVLAESWYFLPGDAYAKSRRIYGRNPFVESQTVANFIASRSGPDDRVFIFGSEPQILFLAGRRSASRYIFAYPLMTPFPDTRARQRDALAEIVHNRPKHIVLVFVPSSLLMVPETPQDLAQGLVPLLASGYHVAAVAPFRNRSPEDREVDWVTGPQAQALWIERMTNPSAEPWCSLVVWERSAQVAVPLP